MSIREELKNKLYHDLMKANADALSIVNFLLEDSEGSETLQLLSLKENIHKCIQIIGGKPNG